MNIETIYKGSKLYNISRPFQKAEKVELVIPSAFKGVALLYEYEATANLPEELLVFLNKIIEGGLKLSSTEVLTANLYYTDVSLQMLAERARSRAVIIFGDEWAKGLKNMHIGHNEIIKVYGMKVLVTDALDVINSSEAAKKAFWIQLKKIF